MAHGPVSTEEMAVATRVTRVLDIEVSAYTLRRRSERSFDVFLHTDVGITLPNSRAKMMHWLPGWLPLAGVLVLADWSHPVVRKAAGIPVGGTLPPDRDWFSPTGGPNEDRVWSLFERFVIGEPPAIDRRPLDASGAVEDLQRMESEADRDLRESVEELHCHLGAFLDNRIDVTSLSAAAAAHAVEIGRSRLLAILQVRKQLARRTTPVPQQFS